MPIQSPVLEAINLELRELEAVAARMRELDERELPEPVSAVRGGAGGVAGADGGARASGLSFHWGRGRGGPNCTASDRSALQACSSDARLDFFAEWILGIGPRIYDRRPRARHPPRSGGCARLPHGNPRRR